MFIVKVLSIFSNFDFSKNLIFRTVLPVLIKEIPIKIPFEIQSRKLPIKVMHDEYDFFAKQDQLLHARVLSQVYPLQTIDIILTFR